MPELSTVNIMDYAMILLYFVIIIWVGIYAARKNKGTDDYFKAGGQVPWFMAGVSNWVSGFSALMFVVAAGYTYKNGTSAALLFTSAFWAYLLGYKYFAPMWRRTRIKAPLEFLPRRFSPSTTYFFTLCSILIQVVGLAQGLYILAIFVSAATRVFCCHSMQLTSRQLPIPEERAVKHPFVAVTSEPTDATTLVTAVSLVRAGELPLSVNFSSDADSIEVVMSGQGRQARCRINDAEDLPKIDAYV